MGLGQPDEASCLRIREVLQRPPLRLESIALNSVDPSPCQVRQHFEVAELAASI